MPLVMVPVKDREVLLIIKYSSAVVAVKEAVILVLAAVPKTKFVGAVLGLVQGVRLAGIWLPNLLGSFTSSASCTVSKVNSDQSAAMKVLLPALTLWLRT